ncbi:SCAN domain-containing protein 3-like [Oopsacas minuta]|uniref:SCAN domain-containing protein 3-like n=1 Tax=Oopsacas minuta TaxID=111878 RepID=A0AAV7JJA6_9METZ|nr:SCAN domain-containing protein 3-like [Oopsacas minuta]
MEVEEHLIDLVQCEVPMGGAIPEEIKFSLEPNSIPLKHCVRSSFDGALNMQDQYVGIATRIEELAPISIIMYCGAHGSNLVMKACSHSSISAVNIWDRCKTRLAAEITFISVRQCSKTESNN